MFRDDRQLAIGETLLLCRDSAHYYRDAAEVVADTELAGLFRSLASERDRLANELVEEIHRLGDMPRLPDPDRESLNELMTRIKALWAGDQHPVVLDERDAHELELIRQVDDALALNLDPRTRQVLERVGASVQSARDRLEYHRSRLCSG